MPELKLRVGVLLIGPRLQPSRIGGATVSFEHLISQFSQTSIPFTVCDITHLNRLQAIRKWTAVLLRVLVGPERIIFLNVSKAGTRYLLPVVTVAAKLRRKLVVARFFGGDLKRYVDEEFGSFERAVFLKISSWIDLALLQTKALIKAYAATFQRSMWLPSSRPRGAERDERPFEKRFVYVGQVSTLKGARIIDEAIQMLPEGYTFDVYGPIVEPACSYLRERPYYRGVLDPHEVPRVLAGYDIFVLPTQYSGEGYPGVLIESFLAGLPCIATNWMAIPEIAVDGVTAVIMKDPSAASLVEAIASITDERYALLRNNVRHGASQFEQGSVFSRLLGELSALTAKLSP